MGAERVGIDAPDLSALVRRPGTNSHPSSVARQDVPHHGR